MAQAAVLVVGDVMTDIIVRPEGPVVIGADRRATIRLLPGGSGANQAAWLASFGVPTIFAGRVGSADHTRQAELLAACGVLPMLAEDDALPTGTLVTLLSSDGERSFLTDRGANLNLCQGDLAEVLLDEVALVHVSGYALFEPGPRAAVLGLLAGAQRRAIPFTIDAASHSFLAEARGEAFLEWTRGANICFANASEAAELAKTTDLERQLQVLGAAYALVVIKQGGRGAAAGSPDGRRWSAGAPCIEVVDTSGAGDAFVAAFLSRHIRGEPVDICLAGAVAAGSRAAATLGARPPGPQPARPPIVEPSGTG